MYRGDIHLLSLKQPAQILLAVFDTPYSIRRSDLRHIPVNQVQRLEFPDSGEFQADSAATFVKA
jgi:hypothetical protein